MGTIEANKLIVRRLHDALWAGAAGKRVLAEIVDPACVVHWPDGSDRRSGKSPAYETAFPDISNHLDLLVAEDDLVVRRWTNTGTHLGVLELDGYDRLPPTGRSVRWSGVNIYRIRDGVIVENWAHLDLAGLVAQVRCD